MASILTTLILLAPQSAPLCSGVAAGHAPVLLSPGRAGLALSWPSVVSPSALDFRAATLRD